MKNQEEMKKLKIEIGKTPTSYLIDTLAILKEDKKVFKPKVKEESLKPKFVAKPPIVRKKAEYVKPLVKSFSHK